MSTPSDSFSSEDSAQEPHSSGEGLPPQEVAESHTTTSPASPSSSPLSQLPPEAQGETNGGPLGCCLGTMVGMLLSLSVALFGRFYADPLASVLHSNLSTAIRVVMFVVALVAITVCGYFGWKIGKRLYREYEEPQLRRQTRKRRR